MSDRKLPCERRVQAAVCNLRTSAIARGVSKPRITFSCKTGRCSMSFLIMGKRLRDIIANRRKPVKRYIACLMNHPVVKAIDLRNGVQFPRQPTSSRPLIVPPTTLETVSIPDGRSALPYVVGKKIA